MGEEASQASLNPGGRTAEKQKEVVMAHGTHGSRMELALGQVTNESQD